ncbi:hypothetical protein ACVPOS_10815 [Staphylococcus aureus]
MTVLYRRFRTYRRIKILHPDLDTRVIFPWTGQGKVARLICDVYKTDGTPFEGDPRANLKRVLKEMEDSASRLNLGPEPEFFLFKLDEGNATLELNDDGGYFD